MHIASFLARYARNAGVGLFLAFIAVASVGMTGKASAQGTGDLLMTTFPTRTFTGTPITIGPVTVIDQTNLNPGGQGNDFSVRIEGFIQAETTGTYIFETFSDDGVRLFVDGTTVINNYTNHPPTIDTGAINLVGGVWYPILLEHYERGGGQRLRLRWQTPTSAGFAFPPSSALSQSEPILSAGGPPVATQDDRVSYIITEEAARSLRANILSNQRANTEARERHAAALRCAEPQNDDSAVLQDECDGLVSRSTVPLSFDGSLTGTNSATKLEGDFFGQSPASRGYQYIYFGEFDVTRFEGGDSTARLSARFALERLTRDRLLGYFVGVEATRSDIDLFVDGDRSGYGLSAGVYAVDKLTKALTWDGFLSVGAGRNDLDIRDGGDQIQGDYTTTSILAGIAVSGERRFSRFTLRPEVNASFGHTNIGEVDVSGGTSPIVDAGGVTLGRLSFEPEIVIPLRSGRSRFDTKEFWVTPSFTCEYQDTTFTDESCGGGLALEWTAGRNDGLLDVSLRASTESIDGNRRDSLSFRIESLF